MFPRQYGLTFAGGLEIFEFKAAPAFNVQLRVKNMSFATSKRLDSLKQRHALLPIFL
jgi:hypothetical protein